MKFIKGDTPPAFILVSIWVLCTTAMASFYLSLPKTTRPRLVWKKGRLLSEDVLVPAYLKSIQEAKAEIETEATTAAPQEVTTMLPPRKRGRRHRRRKNGTENETGVGDEVVSKDVVKRMVDSHKRKEGEGKKRAVPVPDPPKRPSGMIVALQRGAMDKDKKGIKYDSILMDVPGTSDEEEEGFEKISETAVPPSTIPPPKLTPPPNMTVETTTPASSEEVTTGKKTMEVLDLIEEESVGRRFQEPPTPPDNSFGSGKKDIKLVSQFGDRPVAKTRTMVYRGMILSLSSGKKIFAFYGIGFAAPPMGSSRFKPPRPLDPPTRDGPYEATRLTAPCFPSRSGKSSTSVATSVLKDSTTGQTRRSKHVASEDCLYLNILLPDKVVLDKPPEQVTLYPVLVWIHGEGFLSGADKEDYDSAAEFVAETDIILVTIQYRLGAFGFLHLDPSISGGNVGLLDQVQAFRWLEENIECFGGNPRTVTIMGHDLGAAFVGYHLISKDTPGFFRRAVMIGGNPLQTQMFQTSDVAREKAMDLATQLGCVNTKSPKLIMECLQGTEALSIWDVQLLMLKDGHNALAFPFVPTETPQLPGNPAELLESGNGKTFQILLGASANPGSLLLTESVEGLLAYNPTFISYDRFHAILRQILDMLQIDLEMDLVLHQYKNWDNLMDGLQNQIKAADAVGDFYFTCPLRKFADLWSSRGLPTYHFSFAQRSSAHNRSAWMGAVHGDEIDYFFGVPGTVAKGRFTKEEEELSREMVKALANFVKTGSPDKEWERYGRETPHYTQFLAGRPVYGSATQPLYGPRLEKCAFWNDIYPKFVTALGSGPRRKKNHLSSRRNSGYYVIPEGGTSKNSSSRFSSFAVDETCYVAFHNCSRSSFAVYVN